MSTNRPVLGLAAAILLSAVAGCSSQTPTAEPPPGEVRSLTGAHTRAVWVQSEVNDPDAAGDQLILMGFDSDDGKGERVILGDRSSRTMPRLTPRGDRIVYSTRIDPGPSEIFLVGFDGTGLRKLADGFAVALWLNPADGSEWVYVGTDREKFQFRTISRFPIDAPERRELVWNTAPVSFEGFGVTPDGRQLTGMFPWPGAGVADVAAKTWRKLGEGCYTSVCYARGPLFWYFDGSHRNVTIVDVDADTRWMVGLNGAPGFDGAEVSHPRWSNHPRFVTLTGPYNQGGSNQSRTGGPQTEVYIGRFSADFSKIEAWARVTNNRWGDSHPDVWIDAASSPHPQRPAGPIGPPRANAAGTEGSSLASENGGSVVVSVRLKRPGPIPAPQAILPYRHALVVNEYEIVEVVSGTHEGPEIHVAQWAIRDGAVLADARKEAGALFTLTVDPYDSHAELEGERLISDSANSSLRLYYDVGRR